MQKAMLLLPVVITALALVTPAESSIQAGGTTGPVPGSRVRISAPAIGLEHAVGTVQDTAGGTLLVRFQGQRVIEYEQFQTTVSEDTTFTIDHSDITELEVSVGTRNSAAIGGLIGLGMGVGLGLIPEDCTGKFMCFSQGESAVALGGVFGLLGVAIGSRARTDRWETISLPPSSLTSINVRPRLGNGFGFAASLPFGP